MSKSAAVRARAARVIAQVITEGRTLDAALAREETGTPQERGLLRALCYDSLRWYVRLDAIVSALRPRGSRVLEPQLHALVVVGLCQLIYTGIPAHAAVAESVNAARLIGQPRAAGLINALLRRWQREHMQLIAEVDRDTAVAAAHPRWLFDALAASWGEALPQVLAANNAHPPFWLRVNRRRIRGDDYCRKLQGAGISIAARRFDDEAVLLEEAMDVAALPGFAAGEVSVQDAAAQLAARLLAAQPGERVLDACAAPGGKACHVLEMQAQLEQLVAVDVAADRLRRVADNLQRLQLHAALIIGDAAAPASWWDGKLFHRILLDVPCSATGVIRRHPDIKLLRRAQDIAPLAQRQRALLEALWPLLAPGGRLVYATCSILDAENAAVIAPFLAAHADCREVTGQALHALGMGSEPGIGYRIAPGTAGMDGFYYACLEKTQGSLP